MRRSPRRVASAGRDMSLRAYGRGGSTSRPGPAAASPSASPRVAAAGAGRGGGRLVGRPRGGGGKAGPASGVVVGDELVALDPLYHRARLPADEQPAEVVPGGEAVVGAVHEGVEPALGHRAQVERRRT